MWRAWGLAGLLLAAAPDQTETLAAGATRERALAAGQTHAFEVRLEGGDFLHAVATPQGIDIGLRLIGPDGSALLSVDVQNDPLSPEQILAIVDAPGRYRVEVYSPSAGVPDGRYTLRIEAIRPSTGIDAGRVGAMRNLEAGFRAHESPESAARRLALTQLEKALAAFRELGDRELEARALMEMANTSSFLARPDSLDLALQALTLCRQLGNPLRLAEALQLAGRVHDRLGHPAEALAAATEALALAQSLGDATLEAGVRNSLGVDYGKTADLERSVDELRRGLSLARTMRSSWFEMLTLGNLGITARRLGDYRLSLDYYEQSLKLARARGDRAIEANTLNNMGNLYRILGELQKALATHEEALALARQGENADNEARALNTIGSTLYRLGDFKRALEHHDQALEIRRRLDDPAGQAAALDGAGQALHRLGDDEDAVRRLNDALRIRRATGDRIAEAETLVHLAAVQRDLGHLTSALEDAEASVQMADALRGLVASPDLRASFTATEQEQYELYIDVLMDLDKQKPGAGFAERALEASERTRARVLLELLVDARTDIRQGIDPALRERERAAGQRRAAESTRLARAMSRPSSSEELDAARGGVEKANVEYEELEARIRMESPRYAALTQPHALGAAEIQGELDPGTVLLEFALGAEHSWLWTVSTTGVESYELPPRPEIETAARQVYTLLTARQFQPGESPTAQSRRVLGAEADRGRQSISLSRLLLGPAAARLGAAWTGKRLVIVAADMLAYLPFAAMPDPSAPSHPLIEGHEIVALPSASVLAVLRRDQEDRPRAAKTVAILADPVFEAADPRVRTVKQPRGSVTPPATRALSRALDATDSREAHLSRLPFSREEANAIAALVPVNERLTATDFQANRTLATSGQLGSYRLVHFATHGLLNSEHPELSGLVLSLVDADGRAQDGFLRLGDIYNLRLAADVVVLSACQSALGSSVRGEGLIGLTRGFMHAGAPRVVASLWQVDDESTAEVMRLFYRAMLERKLAPAAALRAAQLELRATKRWASPYYWAAFVLQGEWR